MRESNTRTRLRRMLAEDKEELNEESRAAAVRDFRRVAQEYFETDGEISLTVTKEKGEMEVTLSFRAVRVKNFTALR